MKVKLYHEISTQEHKTQNIDTCLAEKWAVISIGDEHGGKSARPAKDQAR
jgi:hypothetical protein